MLRPVGLLLARLGDGFGNRLGSGRIGRDGSLARMRRRRCSLDCPWLDYRGSLSLGNWVVLAGLVMTVRGEDRQARLRRGLARCIMFPRIALLRLRVRLGELLSGLSGN